MASDRVRKEPEPSAASAWAFTADSEVGRDLVAVDWAATPLGPPGQWPQSLLTAVSILLSSRFPMWMAWGPDLTFFCNDAYRRDTLGRKYPWALGRRAAQVWSEIWSDIGPRIESVLATGRATWDEALRLFLERSGYPEETYHTFSYSPLRDDSGVVVGMLCVVSEDTDRVIGERRMRTLRDLGSDPSSVRTEAETLAFAGRQLGRNLRDLPFTLTYLFDENGTARLTAATGIVPGHSGAPRALAADEPEALWPVGSLREGTEVVVPLDGPAYADLPAGDWPRRPSQALAVPLQQQGSAPYGFLIAGLNRYRPLDAGYRGFVELVAGHIAAGVGAARSYQIQQRRAEELAELDRAKTTFFSNISHEFRTPLTLIMGPVQDLREEFGSGDPRVREELEVIHRNGLRLGKLVNTLLDFSRIEAGRMQARYEPVDIATVTAELAAVFRSAVERVGLTLEVDCPPLAEPVYIDRGMWEKVVLNLLSNALKFTFDGGLRVAARAEPEHAVIIVADTGIGIAEAEMPRLFERFHRVENARGRSNEGSGIGLALVKELVGLHGGTIEAKSAVDEGTTFTVRLPWGRAHLPANAIAEDESTDTISATADPFIREALRWGPTDADQPSTPEAEAVALGAISEAADRSGDASVRLEDRVLVADDNADMRDYLTRLLRGAGYVVDTVVDGQAALESARTRAPSLIVSDVMMPRLDGLHLVAALRADPRTAAVPVLLLSARAGDEASIEGLEAGADDYLVKPFSAAELVARVRATMKLARLRIRQARWRAALVDSLQEGFFVSDEHGRVTEINQTFEEILGYGQADLPYEPPHPWWPDRYADPEAYRQVSSAFQNALTKERGGGTVPVIHRDGRQLWVTVTFSHVRDPDTGRRVIVGTLRDATDEHYAVQRDAAVAAVSVRLSQATSLDQTLSGALDELRTLWRARKVVAAVFSGGRDPVVTSAEAGATWQSLTDEERDRLTDLAEQPSFAPSAMRGAGVALEHPQGHMALLVDLGDHRPFTDPDANLLALLAGQITQGLARAYQSDQQRETVLELQRAILGPASLPDGFAVRYEPATPPLQVGGDWYDIVPLPGDQLGIIVGDCVGRGLRAATVMGQMRSACRALLLQDPHPDRALTALDRFVGDTDGALCTSVFCGVLDRATGQLTYSSAGHPPGILVHADGTTGVLEDGLGTVLGLAADGVRPSATRVLPPRTTLLLYTDGLVERRRRPLTDGIRQAADVLHDGRNSRVDVLASHLMSRLAPPAGYDDDVALVLYRHPGPLDVAFPAEATALAPVRNALRGWLGLCGVPDETAQSVLVAVGEACANAVEHGHRDRPGQSIRLRALALTDRLDLAVTDAGTWRPPLFEPHRGHGINLMRTLMDEVSIASTPQGTTVELTIRTAS